MTVNHEPQHVRTPSAASTGLDAVVPGRASHASQLAAPRTPIVSGLLRRKRRPGDELAEDHEPAPAVAEPGAADRASPAWWATTAAGGEPAMVAAAALQLLDATHAAIDDLLHHTAPPAPPLGPRHASPTWASDERDLCWRALTHGRTPEGTPPARVPGAASHGDPDVPLGDADAKLARCYDDEDVGSFPVDDVADH